jgi:hypothetical protein
LRFFAPFVDFPKLACLDIAVKTFF